MAPPPADVAVRAATVADVPAIVALHRDVLAERSWFITLPGEAPMGVDARIRQLRDFDRLGNSVFLTAWRDGVLVGFLTASGGTLARLKHNAKIEVMVDEDARGSGVGRALMANCVAWAEQNPVVHKLALAVFADNARAIALYRAFGFVDEGRRIGEYREPDGTERDDLLMYRRV